MNRIEFTLHPDKCNILVHDLDNSESVLFSEDSTDVINKVLKLTERDFNKCHNALTEIYGQSAHKRYLMARRFIKCNLSIADERTDLSPSGFKLEVVPCPMRGECKWENIVCKPQFTTTLSDREMEVALELCTDKPISKIADDLFISIHTIENHRNSIYKKLNIHSKSELVDWAHRNKLIQF